MLLKQFESSGPYKNFTYIIACEKTKKGAVIDPTLESEKILEELEKNDIEIEYIINTHNHPDHTSQNLKIKEKTNAKIIQHKNSGAGEVSVNDNDELNLGNLNLQFLYTPGHTNHDICILVNNELFAGDTLFVGKVGGTSNQESASNQFSSLKKIMELPEETRVWPGHNNGVTPSSTIGDEKKSNPFCLRLNSFEEFYSLKENWLEFKKKHGIE